MKTSFCRFYSLLWKVSVEKEVATELAFHVEMRTRELIARGMDPEAARASAAARFGDIEKVRRECRKIAKRRDRSMRWSEWTEDVRQDLLFAMRQIKKAPVFAATAVLTLALGIGANTAVFSVVNAVLLKPLPFPEPERLIRVIASDEQGVRHSTSEPDFIDFREQNRSFSDLAAFSIPFPQLTLQGDGEPERFSGVATTGSLFSILGVSPLMGRTFSPEEDKPGSDSHVVVLSHGLWDRRFGGNPSIVGSTLDLNNESWTYNHLQVPWPGMTLVIQSAGDPTGVVVPVREAIWAVDKTIPVPEIRPLESNLADAVAGPRSNMQLLGLFAAVALLMASMGVYGIISYSVTRRHREIGVRLALGARPRSMVTLLLRHGLRLIAIGVSLGVLAALGLTRFLASLLYDTPPTHPATFVAVVLILVAIGALACFIPALRAARVDPVVALRNE